MKRSLLITIVVLLMAALFVSCNANKAEEDQLFEVSIEDSARTLIATSEIDGDPEDLYWYYSATKTSGFFRKGQTEWSPVKSDESKGISGAYLGTFSGGQWTFCFYGYSTKHTSKPTTPTDPKTDAVFYQEGLASTINDAVSLVITLEGGSGIHDYARVVFDSLSYIYADGENGATLRLDVTVDESTTAASTKSATFADGRADFDGLAEISPLSVGSHTLHFNVYYPESSTVDVCIGSYDLILDAVAGRIYTISNQNDTESGITVLDADYTVIVNGTYRTASQTKDFTAPATGSVTVESSIAPSSDAGTGTTVTFPEGSVSEGSHSLTVEVSSVADASTKFTIDEEGKAAVAGISLTIENLPSPTFESPVTIVTYIAKGLGSKDDIKVRYNGDLPDGTVVAYDNETGRLEFTTSHFSEFYVEYACVAINISNNSIYANLQEAIDGAASGDIIKLFKDVEVGDESADATGGITISKDITIDGNSHAIDSVAGRAIWINASGIDVVLANLTVRENSHRSGDYPRGVQIDGNKTDVSLTLNNCSISAGHYAINICGGCNGTVLTINGGSVVSGWAAINIWARSNITVNGAVLQGNNDKQFNVKGWNNFATIVFNTGSDASCSNSVLNCSNSVITGTTTTGNLQTLVDIRETATNVSASFTNCQFNYESTDKFDDLMFCSTDYSNVVMTGCDFYIDGSKVNSIDDLPLSVYTTEALTNSSVVINGETILPIEE